MIEKYPEGSMAHNLRDSDSVGNVSLKGCSRKRINEPKISAELLEKAGFRESKDANLKFDERFFQKKYTDKKGTKYFVSCKYFGLSNNGQQSSFWSFFAQFQIKNDSVNFETVQWFNQDGVHSKKTINDVEDYFAWLWKIHDNPYYELYEVKKNE